RQVGVDRLPVDDEAGGKARQDPDASRAVRLSAGRELEGQEDKPTARRMTSTGAETPVQSSNDAAPCATSTSSPLTTREPDSAAAAAVAVSGDGRSTRLFPSPRPM